MIKLSGFQQDNQGSWISKDPSAQLVYSLDWTEWLPTGDTLASVTHTLQVRSNDPTPIIRGNDGIQGNVSFVEISGGGTGKIYTVTAHITTTDGLTDSRNFRLKVENRSA